MSGSVLFDFICFWTLLALSENACPPEKFGPNCEFKCHCLRKCNRDGCFDGLCNYGFMDPPKCQTTCPKQKFGVNCMFECKCPENDTCNDVNGWCSSNKCRDGFGGAGCQKRIPFLSDPPVVDVTPEKELLISWKPWAHGFQLTTSSVLVYSVEAQQNRDVNSSGQWITLAKVRDTDDTGKPAWIVEKMENFNVVPVTSDDREHLQRVRVLFKNPEPEQAYKFRIGISVLRDKRPPFEVDPSPVTPKWHIIHCGAPTRPSVSANATIYGGYSILTISWELLDQNFSKCDQFWGHEVALVNESGIIASLNVTWPHFSLILSNRTDFDISNAMSYGVSVRAKNKWGLFGPWSKIVLPSWIVFPTTIGKAESSDASMNRRWSSYLTSSLQSYSFSPNIGNRSTTRHVTSSPKNGRRSPEPPVQGRSAKWTLLGRNETHLELLHEGGTSDTCQTRLLKHLRDDLKPYMEVKDYVVVLTNVKEGMEIFFGGLQSGTYYTAVLLCPILSIHSSLTIATSLPSPEKPGDIRILKVTSSTVVVLLPPMEGKLKEQRKKRKKDHLTVGLQKRLYLVIVERLGEIGCCSMLHLIEKGRITWDDQRRKREQVDLNILPNSATSGMYRKSYYLVAKINIPSNYSKSFDIVQEFTVGDGSFSGKYGNPPLNANRSYVIWFGIEDTMDGFFCRSFSHSPVFTTLLPEEAAILKGFNTVQETTVVVLIVTAIFLLVVISFFGLRWMQQKRESTLFKRLRQARLQSLAYLNKEGFRWRCDDVFADLVESAPFSESFCSSAGKSASPFAFPAPMFSFAVLKEDFMSPIPVKDLRSFCERHVSLGTRLPANPVGEDQLEVVSSLITKEFNSFPTGLTDAVASTCRPDVVTSMDRVDHVVLPYERNRVKLKDIFKGSNSSSLEKTLEGERLEDHLSASRVRTLGGGTCVVIQTLTPPSCSAFWLLVWQESITHIVDLDSHDQLDTPTKGDFPVYWPRVVKQRQAFGDLEIELLSKMDLAHYSLRLFWVSKASEGKLVQQWHYHAWTRQSIPVHHISFLNFVRALGEEVPLGRECSIVVSCQILVHCNHGDGRSGIFLAMDALIAQGLMLNVVDVKSCVALLRSERHNLVKTLRQYCFIYECLAEEFDHSGSRKNILKFVTGLRSSEDKLNVPAEVAYEQKLMTSCSYRHLKANMSEGFASCVTTWRNEPEQKGSFLVDGYWSRKAFLVQRSSEWIGDEDFWKAVIDNEIVTVVSLATTMVVQDAGGRDLGATQSFLSTGRSWSAGIFTLTSIIAGKSEELEWTTFRLSITRHPHAEDGPVLQHSVEVMQLETFGRNYKDSVASIEALLRFMNLLKTSDKCPLSRPLMLVGGAHKMQNINEVGASTPLVFDGVGVFIASWVCIEQAISDAVVDVFATCRLVRSYLSSAISSKEEYHLVCLVTSFYLRTYPHSNNDFSRRHLVAGFRWRDSSVDAYRQPSLNRRKVLFLPMFSSSILPFARKKQNEAKTARGDFGGSYQKFPSPRASPVLANKLTNAEGNESAHAAEEQAASKERRLGRFFDSLRRETCANI